MAFFYRYKADPRLQHFIQGYWMLESDEEGLPLHLVPDGFPEIYIFRTGGFADGQPKVGLVGQFNRRLFTNLLPDSKMISIKLYPWTPAALFGPFQDELQNMFLPLSDIDAGGAFGSVLNQCLEYTDPKEITSTLDDFFLKKIDQLIALNPFLKFAGNEILNNFGIVDFDQICRAANTSRRYLELKFKEGIGLSPKQYARLIRVKKASLEILSNNQSKSLRNIAFSLGYYDSSHFRKDFRSIVGASPSDFVLEQHSEIELQADYLEQWDYS